MSEDTKLCEMPLKVKEQAMAEFKIDVMLGFNLLSIILLVFNSEAILLKR